MGLQVNFVDPPLPRFGILGVVDPKHPFALVAVRHGPVVGKDAGFFVGGFHVGLQFDDAFDSAGILVLDRHIAFPFSSLAGRRAAL